MDRYTVPRDINEIMLKTTLNTIQSTNRQLCQRTPIFLSPFPNNPWFLRVCRTILLKTLWEKEKLLIKSNFSFSHRVFYPLGEFSAIFIKFEFVICKLQICKCLKFVVWESRVDSSLKCRCSANTNDEWFLSSRQTQ